MVRLNKHFGYESLEEFRAKECVPATIRFLVGERPPANVLLYSRIATASGWCLKRTNDESSEDAGNGKPLRCRFLTADNRCSIYSVRPSPCRIFPYDIAYKTDSKMPHGMDIHATYAPQNDVDCKGFVAKRTISMWLLKQPAREITQHFLEMEETVKKGLYELKTEVVGSVPFAPIPYFQVGERGPR
jgi:Fe-S-cluster containining protein